MSDDDKEREDKEREDKEREDKEREDKEREDKEREALIKELQEARREHLRLGLAGADRRTRAYQAIQKRFPGLAATIPIPLDDESESKS